MSHLSFNSYNWRKCRCEKEQITGEKQTGGKTNERCKLKRLKDCMKRAEAGEELTIGFLGGSITQGSLATTMENTYAYRVFTWWKQTFPKANVHYVNGGIGGTTSHYGVSRAVTDVLMYQPDFVVVDFSVNDEADIFFQETYEGVVRMRRNIITKLETGIRCHM